MTHTVIVPSPSRTIASEGTATDVFGPSDLDGEARQHAGAELMQGIVDHGTHQLAVGVRIDVQAERRHVAAKHVVGIGRHPHFDGLPELVGGRVGLDHIGDHPHRREIGERNTGAGALPGCT